MAINAKRLLKLADYLETVKPALFRLDVFGYEQECGFAGCAVGWAAHAKLFAGLKFETCLGPIYQGASGWEAVAKVFGFSVDDPDGFISIDAKNLFHDSAYPPHPKPNTVAKRIRKFVRDNQTSAP